MKNIYQLLLAVASIVFTNPLYAQSLGQDAEGYSTIVLPSTSINLDLTNDVASFNFYNNIYERDIIETSRAKFISNIKSELGDTFDTITPNTLAKKIRKQWDKNEKALNKALNLSILNYGLELKGSASNGVATLFEEEEIVGGASIMGVIGKTWKWSNYRKGFEHKISDRLIEFRDAEKKIDSLDQLIIKEIKKLQKLGYLDKTWSEIVMEYKATKRTVKGYFDQSLSIKDYVLMQLEIANPDQIQKKYKIKLNDELKKIEKIIIQASTVLEFIKQDKDGVLNNVVMYNNLVSEKSIMTLSNNKSIYEIEDCCDVTEWQNIVDYWKAIENTQNNKIAKIRSVQNPFSGLITELDTMFKLYREATSYEYKSLENRARKIRSFTLLGRGGATGTKFNYLIDSTATTVENRFNKISYNGYRAEIILNYQFSNRLFTGFATGIEYTSNFMQLDDATFTLKTIDPDITDGTFESSQEVKAKVGNFDRYKRYEINADFVWMIPLKEAPILNSINQQNIQNLYVALNPYIRHYIYDDSETFKNNTILGIGLHGYNANNKKLMGGVFVQTPDFFGNHVNDNVSFGERLQFGLIVKYAFNTFKLKEG